MICVSALFASEFLADATRPSIRILIQRLFPLEQSKNFTVSVGELKLPLENGSFLFLEKSFPGTFTHASKFAAVFFIAWNNADRTRSGYDFLFTWKASLKNVIIFKAKPSIFCYLSSVFLRNIAFICPPVLK